MLSGAVWGLVAGEWRIVIGDAERVETLSGSQDYALMVDFLAKHGHGHRQTVADGAGLEKLLLDLEGGLDVSSDGPGELHGIFRDFGVGVFGLHRLQEHTHQGLELLMGLGGHGPFGRAEGWVVD